MLRLHLGIFLSLGWVSSSLAQDVRLGWGASPDSDVAGYKVYYGLASRTYTTSINTGKTTSYTLSGLATGTYYFAVTAYDLSGNESAFSNEVSKSVSSSTPPPSTPPISGGVLLVDFGKTSSGDTFGLAGWNTVIRDVYTENRDLGPGGVTIVVGDNRTYTFHGVKGAARTFASSEKIVVSWYNNSPSPITFNPAVSFTDSNRRYSDPAGVWFEMGAITVPALGSAQSVFDVGNAAGSYTLVNVNANHQNNQVLVCDKIELVSGQASGSLLPAPTNVRIK